MSEYEKLLRGQVKRTVAQINPKLNRYIADDEAFDKINLTELDFVEVVMNLEQHYNIEMFDEDLEQLKTFGCLIQYLKGIVNV